MTMEMLLSTLLPLPEERQCHGDKIMTNSKRSTSLVPRPCGNKAGEELVLHPDIQNKN